MRRILLVLSVIVFSGSVWAQELTVHGRVVDAKTGEALPYVSIYAGKDKGTLSNSNGEFKLKVDEGSSIVFSYVGYNKQTLTANTVPNTIRLKPYTTSLKEITVQAISDKKVLKRIIKNLRQDYKTQGKMAKKYFFRTTTEMYDGTFIAEAFMIAHSVVNVRYANIISGLQGNNAEVGKEEEDDALNFNFSNANRLIEVGPTTFDSQFWKEDIKPLSDYYILRNYYDVEMQHIYGEDGKGLYKIVFTWKENVPVQDIFRRNITGTAYVDAETCRLLRFDGSCHHHSVTYGPLMKYPATINFHLEYDYSQGSASVSNLAIQGGTDLSRFRTMLFAIDNTEQQPEEVFDYGTNIISAIKDAGYNPKLWEEYDIVKRTKDEEVAAFGEAADSLNRKWNRKAKIPKAFKPLIEHLKAFGETLPQEKVYVHMDNTCYFQGDTIWFTAYTQETYTGGPSDISGVLYVELLNNDGYLVERKLIEMKKGRGNGFFVLNNQIKYSGFYELRAYTRWQLNFGDKETEHEYFRDYDKLYSRVFPVYDKPSAPGDYTHNMTPRVMRQTFKADIDEKEKKPVLSLFPEGGNLIAGLKNRVAFEAAMTDGEQLQGTLTIGDDTVKTVHRGRGMFALVPQKGVDQEVTFVSTTGEKVTTKLPQPEETGVVVRTKQEKDYTVIETELAGLNADSLALTIMHEGVLEDYYVLGDSLNFKIEGLPAGVHQVTVFDTQGRVWADRLFFITQPKLTESTLTVSGLQNEYTPYEKIDIDLAASESFMSGNSYSPEHLTKGHSQEWNEWATKQRREKARKRLSVSLSIRDGSRSDALFDNGNIMTEMLLSSEIKGFIPNPGWYFEKDDEEHQEALDLLMMTQGWRRFVWRDMAVKGTWNLTQPDERAPIVMGRIDIKPAGKNSKPNLTLHAELVSIDSNEAIVGDYSITDNTFRIQCPKFYDKKILFLSVTSAEKLNLGENDYQAYISWPYPRFVKPYSFYQSHLAQKPSATGDIPTKLVADSAKTNNTIEDAGQRVIYRGRRYILPGFSSPAEFYNPDYSKQTPPELTDYRRTLYWNPDLKLDKNGKAHVTFYNNSNTTHFSIEAEGMATDGTLLWGKTE